MSWGLRLTVSSPGQNSLPVRKPQFPPPWSWGSELTPCSMCQQEGVEAVPWSLCQVFCWAQKRNRLSSPFFGAGGSNPRPCMDQERSRLLNSILNPRLSFVLTRFYCVALAGQDLAILLPPIPECWNHKCAVFMLKVTQYLHNVCLRLALEIPTLRNLRQED